jgi:hypothetical protein
MKTSTTGDLGDVLYLLCLLKQIPHGPHTLCLRSSSSTKAKGPEGVQRMFDLLAPLVRLQPYIANIQIIQPGDPVDWKSEGFRERHYTKGETLMRAHLNHLIKTHSIGQNFTADEPWLYGVEPSPRSKGRVVINRTGRYRNERFPWKEIVAHLRNRLLFVGLHHEWREFIGHHGYVEFQPTTDMLEVARLIKGSDLFIGNQSCANAIAEGLKHNLIQETHLGFPDCIYVRPNASHVADGVVTLPDGTVLRGVRPKREKKTHTTPPGNWRYNGGASPCFELLVREVAKRENLTIGDAEDAVYDANVERCPAFFADHGEQAQFLRVQQALENYRL